MSSSGCGFNISLMPVIEAENVGVKSVARWAPVTGTDSSPAPLDFEMHWPVGQCPDLSTGSGEVWVESVVRWAPLTRD
ncbi:hypothetical protein NDU88_001031 [Pleurodeles waltl]|uniref:Uncharacterized protein n=1 Tax=Pleurodeles waltl TaxID=8319 RepID=A0AAV7U8Z6_PLEWA|nr:hypothetical protein NDU88_001031 [Pleurodeles waltl]